MKSSAKIQWIKWVVVPCVLLILWIALTFYYIIKVDQSFLVLSYNHGVESFSTISHDRLLKGQKLTGEFVAQENNLGIVALRFKSFQRIPYRYEDAMVFRIKEKNQKNWYYENNYRSGFVYDMPFLPFGFPLIPDSKSKTYVFELESLKGTQINGVALSHRQPFLTSKYQADKNTLQHDYNALFTFAYRKFINAYSTIDISYSSFVFSLPLLLYLFWISPARRKVVDPALASFNTHIDIFGRKLVGAKYSYIENIGAKFVSYYLLIFIVAVILIDIVILQIYNDLLYLIIAALWFFLMRGYKLKGNTTLIIGLFVLLLAPVYMQFNVTNIAEKAGAWAFIFLVVGLVQLLCEMKRVYPDKTKSTKKVR